MSYRVVARVSALQDDIKAGEQLVSNNVVLATEKEAEAYGKDWGDRWKGVIDYEVENIALPVNYEFKAAGLRKIEDPGEGSVSWGTMKPEDLIPAFLGAVDERDKTVGDFLRYGYSDLLSGNNLNPDGNVDRTHFLLEDLFEALNELALPGQYFGASESDGSDFGFWRLEDTNWGE